MTLEKGLFFVGCFIAGQVLGVLYLDRVSVFFKRIFRRKKS